MVFLKRTVRLDLQKFASVLMRTDVRVSLFLFRGYLD